MSLVSVTPDPMSILEYDQDSQSKCQTVIDHGYQCMFVCKVYIITLM